MRRQAQHTKAQRLSYQIAGILLIIATLGFTFMYFFQKNHTEKTEIAEQEAEKSETVSKTVEPQKKATETEIEGEAEPEKKQTAQTKEEAAQQVIEQVAETSALSLHFPEQLAWPIEGKVILNYSMDQTVYYKTLKQYQYNPAVLIAGEVNDAVASACEGKIVSITNDAKTGTTLTMDIGDGYQAIYGQLKEIPVATGEYVAKGQCIGYINEPSKYFLSEGANLYFQVLKDGNPINPQEYLEQ